MSEQRTAILRTFLVPPPIMGYDTREPLVVRQWRAGYFGEPNTSRARRRALEALGSGRGATDA